MKKVCAVCPTEFEAYRNKKTCSPECTKSHRKKRAQEYAEDNKAKIAAYKHEWRQSNKESVLKAKKDWQNAKYIADPVYAENRRAVVRKWSKDNPAKANAKANRGRCSRLNRTPTWANHLKIDEFYAEAKRLEEVTGIPFVVDHIIPLQGKLVSGFHIETNLQIITDSENRSKSNKYEIDM